MVMLERNPLQLIEKQINLIHFSGMESELQEIEKMIHSINCDVCSLGRPEPEKFI